MAPATILRRPPIDGGPWRLGATGAAAIIHDSWPTARWRRLEAESLVSAMDRGKIKVTDRRLFTEDGELRPHHEESEDTAEEPAPRPRVTPPAAAPSPAVASPDRRGATPVGGTDPARPAPAAPADESGGGPQFLDLVDILCQQIAIAMGDPRLGEGAPAPDLRVARVYIDLLGVLQEKTRGNLTEEEAAVLEELVFRFRMLYVEKQRR